jgi:hypothetical protein
MLQSIREPKYRTAEDIDWAAVSTKPGITSAEDIFLAPRNSATGRDHWGDAALIIRRLNQLMGSIREIGPEIKGWATFMHYALTPVKVSDVVRVTVGEELKERKKRGRLGTVVVLLAYSEKAPQWLGEAARDIRDFTENQKENGYGDVSLSVDRALSGIRLLATLSDAFQGQPFVYPSPGDSLTIELITKKGRLTIIHDARGNQLIQSTSVGASSASYPSDEAGFDAIRGVVQDFYRA